METCRKGRSLDLPVICEIITYWSHAQAKQLWLWLCQLWIDSSQADILTDRQADRQAAWYAWIAGAQQTRLPLTQEPPERSGTSLQRACLSAREREREKESGEGLGMGKGHRHRWNVNKIARGMDEWSNPKAQISKPVQFIWGCSPANSKNEETPSPSPSPTPTCTSTGSHNVKEKCDKAKGDKSKPNAIFLRLAGQTKRPPLRATRPRSGRTRP